MNEGEHWAPDILNIAMDTNTIARIIALRRKFGLRPAFEEPNLGYAGYITGSENSIDDIKCLCRGHVSTASQARKARKHSRVKIGSQLPEKKPDSMTLQKPGPQTGQDDGPGSHGILSPALPTRYASQDRSSPDHIASPQFNDATPCLSPNLPRRYLDSD